jgi:hypothetical protein
MDSISLYELIDPIRNAFPPPYKPRPTGPRGLGGWVGALVVWVVLGGGLLGAGGFLIG